MSRRTDRAGFTLLEAAIALVIVGMAAVAVLSSFGTTLRTAARARHALEAEALAGQRLAYASLLSNAELAHLPDSVAHGRFPAPFDAYAWETTAKELYGDDAMFEVSVAVTWENGRYALPTRLYRPPPIPGGQ
jgi:prepilin-type N-terminal cleavage/methylation domain-containing protein